MNVNGEFRIGASREVLWDAMRDPETLRACIPGCQEVAMVGTGEYRGRVTAQVGAVTTTFNGSLSLKDEAYPGQWALTARMESPSAGWAEGEALVTLTADGAMGTVLSYRARMEPGGRLASVGQRLLHGVAIRLANDFFTRLIERLKPHPPAKEPQEWTEPLTPPPHRLVAPLAPSPPKPTPPPPPPTEEPSGFRPGQRFILLAGTAIWLLIVAFLFWPRG